MSRPHSTPPNPDPRGERLQKILAAAGIASRRASEQLILDGRVSVNGRVVRELGTRADPSRDRIRVDEEAIGRPERLRHAIVNKPRGVLTTTRDPEGRKTILDLVPDRGRLYPVGRLDVASEGLVLLTNDGPLAQALLHPSNEVPRTYRVSANGVVASEALRALASGIDLDGWTTSPCEVQLIDRDEQRSVVEVTLHEGHRHQIRRMFESVGHPVRRLLRTRFGPLRLAGLAAGRWRPANEREIAALERMSPQAAGARSRSSRRRKSPTRDR